VLALLGVVLLPIGATAGPVGLGVSGGVLTPAGQDDQAAGSVFGFKVRTRLSDLFTLEPNINIGSFGDAEIEGVGERDGSSLDHYGVDITFGYTMAKTGLKPYAFIGGGVYNTKRDGDETTNKSGWSFGVGLAVGIRPELDFDIRGRFNIVSSEGSSSRKSGGITAGITYYVGDF
jgi:hypothetical protein